MKNLLEFFALAKHQVERTRGVNSEDAVLCELLPPDHHPTKDSWVVDWSFGRLPNDRRLEFMLAYYWLGCDSENGKLIMPLFKRPSHELDQALDDRASLIIIGVIKAPADAPCRTYPWRPLQKIAEDGVLTDIPAFYESVARYLGYKRAEQVVADIRNSWDGYEQPNWVPLVEDCAVDGLGWVYDNGAEKITRGRARVIVDEILDAAPDLWKIRPPWCADTVVWWAEVCWRYVMQYRLSR